MGIWRATADSGRGSPPTGQASDIRSLAKLSGNRTAGVAAQKPRGVCMLITVYLIAITAEAMSGALAAGRRRMDMFGVAFIAFVTALGGGTVRDILLGHFPVSWTHPPHDRIPKPKNAP